ncbi:C6 transcription factor [Paraphaeosphaeria sporulosa]
MPQLRNPHTKSRVGCLTCERRHNKCGKERLACQKCVDRDLQCDYVGRESPNSLASSARGSTEPGFPVEIERTVAASDVAVAMDALRKLAGTVAKYVQPEKLGIYLSGIDSLELAFESVATTSHLGPVVAWPAMVDERLLEFFKQGDPMVELIMLHYGHGDYDARSDRRARMMELLRKSHKKLFGKTGSTISSETDHRSRAQIHDTALITHAIFDSILFDEPYARTFGTHGVGSC